MFRHLNLEKPTKWFLSLASDQKDAESPINKLKKYCDKYKDTPEWGRKYEKRKKYMKTCLPTLKTSLIKGKERRVKP